MKSKNKYIFARNKKVRINKLRLFITLIVIIAVIVGAILLVRSIFDKTGDSDKNADGTTSSVAISSGAITAEGREQGIKIMIAAKGYVYSGLTYDPSYFDTGYPPAGRGVCTDVIWHGLEGIDVVLKDLVDSDVASNFDAYSNVIEVADPSIDFRNVPVLETYLQRHAQSLSTDVRNILAWQPGDIVVFESSHIAIVSSIRNIFGEPYIIQHGHDPAAEEDRINAVDGMEISGHFRWPVEAS